MVDYKKVKRFLNDVWKSLFIKYSDYDESEVKENLLFSLSDLSIPSSFINGIEIVKSALNKDLDNYLKFDPSITSIEEVIFSNLGFYAIFVYRISNFLYKMNVEMIPQMLSAIAHSKTGIDINPKCEIDEGFFIDHGTGVVIGETAKIGRNVRIYQGVTLGCVNLHSKDSLKGTKRHPTIEDDVILYANSIILGGNTIIKKGAVIGCGALVTKSVESYTTVKK